MRVPLDLRFGWTAVIIAIAVPSLFSGCSGPTPSPSPDAVATFDDGEVTSNDLAAYLRQLPAGRRVAPPGTDPSRWRQRQIERVFLRRLVVTDEAVERVMDDPAFAAEAARAGQSALARAHLARQNTQLQVTRAELEAYFARHRDRLVLPEMRSFRSILVSLPEERSQTAIEKARERARDLRRRILDGEAFEDVARDESESANAGTGGRVGPIARNELQGEIAAEVFSLETDELSDVVECAGGLHLFQLISIRPADPTDLESHLARVAEAVMVDKREAYYFELVDAALAERGLKMPTWPEIDDPTQFDASIVLFTVDDIEIRATDVLRSARQERATVTKTLQNLVGDAILAKTFAAGWPEDAARIETGVQHRLATATVEWQALLGFLESMSAERLESYYNENPERFETDVQIELTRFSWPVERDDPRPSLDEPTRFAVALENAPDEARRIWERASDNGAVRRGYPLIAMSVIAEHQPGLIRNLSEDPTAGAVVGPFRSATRVDVVKVETVVPSRRLSFAEARARIPQEMLRSDRGAMIEEWIEDLSEQHHLRILEDRIDSTGPTSGESGASTEPVS